MEENPSTTLGQLVAGNEKRAQFFEKLGFDFCCGGKDTLQHVCEKKGLDAKDILNQLHQFDQQLKEANNSTDADVIRDMHQWDIPSLVKHILDRHHSYLKTALPALLFLAQKVARVHGSRHPELGKLSENFAQIKDELEHHLWKEEEVLFPLCLQHPSHIDSKMVEERVLDLMRDHAKDTDKGLTDTLALIKNRYHSLSNVVTNLEEEHVETGNALVTLRDVSHNYRVPDDGCNSYRRLMTGLEELERDLHVHIHKENNVLFVKLLAPANK